MKIIIVGAGIGGLSAYLSLRKHLGDAATIRVYESHEPPTSTTSNIGGGLGLAPNGQRAISSVSPKAIGYITARGFPGNVFWIRKSSGRLLGTFGSGSKSRYGFDQLLLRRSTVYEGLLQEMPQDAIVWGAKIQAVQETSEGVQVNFADGSSELVDLVLGADGVRSVVRDCVFDKQYPATYDGMTGVGGFLSLSSLSETFRNSFPKEGVTMTFGEDGFFGYSLCTPYKAGDEIDGHEIQWWSTYEASSPPSRAEPHRVIREQLLERHGLWKSPHDSPGHRVYEEIIKLGCGGDKDSSDNLIILPRYLAPRIPHWCSGTGKIILLGDAAHAMPPDSGQGVSCAAEDSAALGLLLRHYYLTKKLNLSETFKRTSSAYEGLRMKRVWKILDVAKRNGSGKKKMSWWTQWIRDLFFGLLCMLPESLNDSIFGYDVEVAVAEYLQKEI